MGKDGRLFNLEGERWEAKSVKYKQRGVRIALEIAVKIRLYLYFPTAFCFILIISSDHPSFLIQDLICSMSALVL